MQLLIVTQISSYKIAMRHTVRAYGGNIFSLAVCSFSFCS